MPPLTINGLVIEAEEGKTVLEAARESGFTIPTLCHHSGLSPYGACRLCLVEVKAGFRPGLTASCTLPVMDGLVLETDSPPVTEARRFVAGLLLARAPENQAIKDLAASLGVTGTDLTTEPDECVLCGRCVRACAALGLHAVSFAFRGPKRRVLPALDRPSPVCIACRACEEVCPTGAVKARLAAGAVEIEPWHTRQEIQACPDCGRPYVTTRQDEHLRGLTPEEQHLRSRLCPACRRRKAAAEVAVAGGLGFIP
ncbi:MAG: 2Fe-2S iron-sulfur cluster-binding protein [Thermodesulfobacteriota bacterium]